MGEIGAQAPSRAVRIPLDALTGVLAGLLAAVAWYALGVNLLQIDLGVPRFNEVAVFALAALAAYFGIALTAPKPAG